MFLTIYIKAFIYQIPNNEFFPWNNMEGNKILYLMSLKRSLSLLLTKILPKKSKNPKLF